MDERIIDLVLKPFRDVVQCGRTAAANSKTGDSDNAEMESAAQSLVREGERALRKIEPLCQRHFERYGVRFVNAIAGNGTFSFPVRIGGPDLLTSGRERGRQGPTNVLRIH